MAETQDRGAPKAYTVLGKSFHDGRLYRGGETIMLYDDEVGPHHAEIAPVEAAPAPVKAKRVRKVKPPAAEEPAAATEPAKIEAPKAAEPAARKKRSRPAKPAA